MVRFAEVAIKRLGGDAAVTYQVGVGGYRPTSGDSYEVVSRPDYQTLLEKCDLFITHAGVGGIVSGVSLGKPVIIMPRLASFGEHRNDHQLATASAVSGAVMVANTEQELGEFISAAYSNRHSSAVSASALNRSFMERLSCYM